MPDQSSFADFASLYDQMIHWDRRLGRELPFYRKLFVEHRVASVLDVACGPGHHAVAFAGWGLKVTAVDADPSMLDLARGYARRKNLTLDFIESDFLSLATHVSGPFDAILCIGNSFPALRTSEERRQVLDTFAALLASGGILVLHLLNFEHLLASIDAGTPTRVRTSPDGSIRFMKSFHRLASHVEMSIEFKRAEDAGGRFVYELYPVNEHELHAEIEAAGVNVLGAFSDYEAAPFDAGTSEDLILVARKP